MWGPTYHITQQACSRRRHTACKRGKQKNFSVRLRLLGGRQGPLVWWLCLKVSFCFCKCLPSFLPSLLPAEKNGSNLLCQLRTDLPETCKTMGAYVPVQFHTLCSCAFVIDIPTPLFCRGICWTIISLPTPTETRQDCSSTIVCYIFIIYVAAWVKLNIIPPRSFGL